MEIQLIWFVDWGVLALVHFKVSPKIGESFFPEYSWYAHFTVIILTAIIFANWYWFSRWIIDWLDAPFTGFPPQPFRTSTF